MGCFVQILLIILVAAIFLSAGYICLVISDKRLIAQVRQRYLDSPQYWENIVKLEQEIASMEQK